MLPVTARRVVKKRIIETDAEMVERGKRMSEARTAIGWTGRYLSRIIGIKSDLGIREREAGIRSIPEEFLQWIEKVAAFHKKNPPPPIFKD